VYEGLGLLYDATRIEKYFHSIKKPKTTDFNDIFHETVGEGKEKCPKSG